MTKKRIYRCCISFLVICCVLFNIAAIPARAAVTTITSGIIGLLFSIGMGIVAVDLTWDLINGVERSMYDSAIDYYAAEAEKKNEFITWFNNLKTDISDGIVETTATVRDAIRHWGAGLMTGDGIEFEADLPEGYVSCGDILLPDFSTVWDTTKYPNVLYLEEPSTKYLMFYSSTSAVTSSYVNFGSFASYRFKDSQWTLIQSDTSCQRYPKYFVWSSSNLVDSNGAIVFSGSNVSSSSTDIFYPSTYVGEIPSKIQSGEADEDQIYVPERLDVTQILTGEVDDLEAVNDISTQLAEGTLTYEQYLEMIQANDDVNIDVGTDVWDPPDDPGTFALDLTQYFPFCIPFDLYAFFSCLNADPVTPVIHWEIAVPGGTSLPIDLDLSPFDGVAKLLRTLQLLLFCVGLAFKTRDLIKG